MGHSHLRRLRLQSDTGVMPNPCETGVSGGAWTYGNALTKRFPRSYTQQPGMMPQHSLVGARVNDWLNGHAFEPEFALPWVSCFWADDPVWRILPTWPGDGGSITSWPNACRQQDYFGGIDDKCGDFTWLNGGLHCPYSNNTFAWSADNAGLNPAAATMVIEVDFNCGQFTAGTTQTFAGQWATGQLSWLARIGTTGIPQLSISTNGSTNTGTSASISAATAGLNSGQRYTIKFTYHVAAGTVDFAFSSTFGSGYSNWGTTGRANVVGPAFNGSGHLATGNQSSSTLVGTSAFLGDIYRVRVTMDGTVAYDANFETATAEAATFTESSTNAATVNIWDNCNLTQFNSSNRPTFNASYANLNGRSAVVFDGVTQYIGPFKSSIGLAVPYSIVTVAYVGNIGTTTRIYTADGAIASSKYFANVNSSKWNVRWQTSLSSTSASTIGPHMALSKPVSGATDSLLIDGTSVLSGDAGDAAYGGLTLGAGNDGTFPAQCAIAFVGVYNGDITADKNWRAFVQWVREYYGMKWIIN